MGKKPTYEELEQRIKKLEKEAGPQAEQIQVPDINIGWDVKQGTCTFENLPVAMMWVDTTLSGLMSGVQAMTGTKRFELALQSEGRKSVEADWRVISRFSDFRDGFKAIANIAAVAGWGKWKLVSLDENKQRCTFRIKNSWEGRYQKSLGVCWNSGMLAGKMAGYCSKLFETDCWAKQTAFIAKGDNFDEFVVAPSERSVEREIENLLVSDEATRADMAVALQKLREEIEDRKRAEEALQESEGKYRTVLEANPDPVVVYDIEGKVIYFNPAFTRVFGWTLEERLGNKMDVFVPAKAWRETKIMIEKVLAGERFSGIETHRYNKKGEIIPVSISGAIYKDQNGNPIGSVINLRDITEQKKLEAQLQQAQKMESIGTLAGGIAHDFNNILGIIIGNTELALDDISERDRAHFNLEEIRTASLRAKDVVKQLLSFARKTDLEQKPIKLIPVVKDSIKLLRAIIPKNIDIRQNITDTSDTIFADPTQIHQVMINLCTNASHAMQETGGILGIEIENVLFEEYSDALHPDLTPGTYVKLTVSDTGQGIHPELKDRIFDPYFTTKEVGKGTGMGLSVVHGIVKNYGGAISVESELGKGTTFYIYFPVMEEEAVIETETVEELPTGNERILFVDDDKSIIYVGRYRLERLGYQVETKTNPVEALELFRANPDQFDLVITDMAMPQMTGDQMMKEILKIRPDTPIILCTGFSEKIDEKKAKEIGATEYVEKPVDKRNFAIKIRSVLDGKKV